MLDQRRDILVACILSKLELTPFKVEHQRAIRLPKVLHRLRLHIMITAANKHLEVVSSAHVGGDRSTDPNLADLVKGKSQYRLTTLQIAHLELRVAMSVT